MKKQKIHIFLFSLVLLMVSGSFMCNNEKEIIPSYSNGSGYRYKIFKTKKNVNDSLWVQINIRDKNNDFIQYGNQVITECTKTNIENGHMSLLMKKVDVESIFSVSSVGYFSVETKSFFFQKNDSIVIDFFLGEYDRPIIHCE